jgi:hypothetical protein
VCRLTSHYIVPSLTWPTSTEEKEAIVAGGRTIFPLSALQLIVGGLVHDATLALLHATSRRGSPPGVVLRLTAGTAGASHAATRVKKLPALQPSSAAPSWLACAAGYKAKLSTVDCRYFNYGDGSCPFGCA